MSPFLCPLPVHSVSLSLTVLCARWSFLQSCLLVQHALQRCFQPAAPLAANPPAATPPSSNRPLSLYLGTSSSALRSVTFPPLIDATAAPVACFRNRISLTSLPGSPARYQHASCQILELPWPIRVVKCRLSAVCVDEAGSAHVGTGTAIKTILPNGRSNNAYNVTAMATEAIFACFDHLGSARYAPPATATVVVSTGKHCSQPGSVGAHRLRFEPRLGVANDK